MKALTQTIQKLCPRLIFFQKYVKIQGEGYTRLKNHSKAMTKVQVFADKHTDRPNLYSPDSRMIRHKYSGERYTCIKNFGGLTFFY